LVHEGCVVHNYEKEAVFLNEVDGLCHEIVEENSKVFLVIA